MKKTDEVVTDDNSLQTDERGVTHAIRIGDNLHNRITKHIKVLKYLLDTSPTKKGWVHEALREKAELDRKKSPEELTGDRYLHFTIDEELNEEIEKKVNLIKKIRISFSKKQWILEALYDKLDRDELLAKKRLDEKCRAESPYN